MKTTIEQLRKELLETVEFSATLVKDNYDPNTKEGRYGASEWSITIRVDNRSFTTKYFCGPAYRTKPDSKLSYNKFSIYNAEILSRTKPIPPKIDDVFYCLTSDARYVSNGESFEDFCCELGYDTDSRQAERNYHDCISTMMNLKRLGFDLNELNELFTDY